MLKTKMLFTLSAILMILGIFGLTYYPAFGVQRIQGAVNFVAYPIPGADVHASNTNGTGDQFDFTNSTGQYFMNHSITDTGIYTVEASANGYIKAEKNTTISALTDVNTVDFVLNRSAIIQGKVVGKSGSPVVGVYVRLYENSSYSSIDQTQTDSNGVYYFATDVSTGVYFVKASFFFPTFSLPWYRDNPYLANGYVEGQSQAFSAIQGLVTTAPDLVLENSGVITGTVKDNHGSPIPNATVLMIGHYPNLYYMMVEADVNGVYRISYNVVNGTYTVTPGAEGFVGSGVDVVATQTGTVTKDLTMYKTATLSGHVWRASDNKPVPDVSISLFDDSFTYFESGSTNITGAYAITEGLGPSNYTVTVELDGLTLNTTRITLTAGENRTLDFKIDAYFISGTVFANVTGGTPLMYPFVDLTFSDFAPAGGSTSGDINGTYMLSLAIAPGTNGNSYNANFTVSAYGYNTTITSKNVTVGTDFPNIDFALPKTPIIPPVVLPSATMLGTVLGGPGPDLPFSYQWWHLIDSGYMFMVGINASSHVDFVYESIASKIVSISVWGPEGTSGDMTVWIPNAIFQGPFTVTSFPGPNPTLDSEITSGNYTVLHITYGHSSKTISFESTTAVPEFQGPMVLIGIVVAVAIAVYLQKKWTVQPKPKLQTFTTQ